MSNNIKLYTGDGQLLKCTVTSTDGVAITIDKAWFTVKHNLSDQDSAAPIAYNSVDDPSNCYITNNGTTAPVVWVKIAGANTQSVAEGTYAYDVQIKLTEDSEVHTVLRAEVSFVQDVTRSRA